MAIRNRKKVAVQANFLFSGSQQLWSSAGEGRGGAGCVRRRGLICARHHGVARAQCCGKARAWRRGAGCVRHRGTAWMWLRGGGADSRYEMEQGAVEAVFRFDCQNGQIAKSFQNFIGKTHLKKIFLDGACTAKYFIKLCLFAKQPVATKEEMTRGSV